MLNLSEQWKQAYAEYLTEQESEITKDVDALGLELSEAQAEISNGYSILENYFAALSEDPTPRESGEEFKTKTDTNELVKQLITLGQDSFFDSDEKKFKNYEPAATFTSQKISDMGFPQNVMFFIAQLIKWIRNIVVYFIEKFKNLLRRLVGAEPVTLDPSALKFDLERMKKVEQISHSIDFGKGKDNVVKAWRIKPDDINLLEGESFAQMLGIVKDESPKPVEKERVIVTVDLSRDIMSLKELMQHFYDLFDNAYGSNNEKLFASDDLEIILDMFHTTIKNLKTGDVNIYSIGGIAAEAPAINKNRVRDNLILTNTNINALKQAYVQTSEKIRDIVKIINSKEMLMLSDMGVDFRLLTSSTYAQLKKILDTMPARFREANKLEKDLSKIQKKYEKLISELSSMQRTVASVSNVTYDSIVNRKVSDLVTAANWMSQTVTLRLAGLGLYIRELKDVRDAIVMLSKVNLGRDAEKKLYRF